jgi:hypothetical protein
MEAAEAREKRRERGRALAAIVAVVLSVVGAVLLGFSFLATGSDMAVVTGDAWQTSTNSYEPYVALCVDQKLVLQTFRQNSGGMNIAGTCPSGERHPIAEVTHESSTLFLFGWLAVIVSALMQIRLATLPPLPAKFG